jgi:hypothetical protein
VLDEKCCSGKHASDDRSSNHCEANSKDVELSVCRHHGNIVPYVFEFGGFTLKKAYCFNETKFQALLPSRLVVLDYFDVIAGNGRGD